MGVNTKKLGEIYKEWRGNESCYDNGNPVFEADELLDFAEFCLTHEANGADKSTESCHIQNVSTRFSEAVEDIDSNGLECGIEDVGITDRYEAMQYGFEQCKERALEAIGLVSD